MDDVAAGTPVTAANGAAPASAATGTEAGTGTGTGTGDESETVGGDAVPAPPDSARQDGG